MIHRLYGDLRSGCATIEMALAEIGAAVELRRVNPMGPLPPADDPARAEASRWSALASGGFRPAVTRNDGPERFSTDPAHAHAPAVRQAARAGLYPAVTSRWMGGAEGPARQAAARPAAGPIRRKHFGAERAVGD